MYIYECFCLKVDSLQFLPTKINVKCKSLRNGKLFITLVFSQAEKNLSMSIFGGDKYANCNYKLTSNIAFSFFFFCCSGSWTQRAR